MKAEPKYKIPDIWVRITGHDMEVRVEKSPFVELYFMNPLPVDIEGYLNV